MKAELLLDHMERMLTLGADVGFGRLDEILQLSLGCVRQAAAFAGSHRHPESHVFAGLLWSRLGCPGFPGSP
jgi:hypothetical protein